MTDDRDTRFELVSVLETLDWRAYVIAGGSDDGLALMELLPCGRPLPRATIADDLEMVLTYAGALAVVARGVGLDIFVTGLRLKEMPQMRFEPGRGVLCRCDERRDTAWNSRWRHVGRWGGQRGAGGRRGR